MKANGSIDMVALVRAALDQPKPTNRLKRALNEILDALEHPLSTKHQDRLYQRRERQRV